MRTAPKAQKIALAALEAAVDGFEILFVANMYPLVYAKEGFGGISRIVERFRRQDIRSWLRKARRAKHIESKRIGNRLHVSLTDAGWSRLLKLRMCEAPKLPQDEMILISFDFPVTQRNARDSFRNFLKSCGIRQMQKSLWFSRRDVEATLNDFVKQNGSRPWIRVFHASNR